MPTPKQAYAVALRDVARRFITLDRETAALALEYLRAMKARLQLELTTAEAFNAFRLTELTTAVDRLIVEYEAQLISLTTGAIRDSARLGALSVVEPLQSAGLTVGFFQPSPAQLNVVLDFSADLIRGITAETRKIINSEIKMAALGERSTISAMQAINDKLGIPSGRKPPASGIAYRGERIVRTEVGRVFNLSTHSQQLATAQSVPGLEKAWLATGDGRTRLTHLIAHGQQVPVNRPFIVGGAELMYPLDPAGPPQETINCRCVMATVHPEIGMVGGPLDARIGKEVKRRKEAA